MASPQSERFRRRSTPHRRVGDQMVLRRPGDGTALVLGATATIVWDSLVEEIGWSELEVRLANAYRSIPPADRAYTLQEVLSALESEGLVDRTAA